jgi:hypothetical protein
VIENVMTPLIGGQRGTIDGFDSRICRMTTPDTTDPSALTRRERRRARARSRRRLWFIGIGAIVAVAALGVAFDASPMADGISGAESAAAQTPSVPDGLVDVEGAQIDGPAVEIDNRVFVVGDSVIQAATHHIATDLPDWSLIADTRVSRFTGEGLTIVEERRDEIGDIAVVGLGNNYNGDKEQFAVEVTEMLSLLEGVDHIIWLTVGEFDEDREDVNDVLEFHANADDRLLLADWNSWWAAEPGFTGADELHLTEDGALAMAALVAQSVSAVTAAANEVPAPDPAEPSIRNYSASGRLLGDSTDRSSRRDTSRSGRSTGSTNSSRRSSTPTTSGSGSGSDSGTGSEVPEPEPPTPPSTSPEPTSPPSTSAPSTSPPSTAPPSTAPPPPDPPVE